MSDEWSLRGKGVWKDYQFKMEEHWYPASDIETLRQKLIEDIEEDYANGLLDVVGRTIMKETINKRFGVEE